jgi:hypothetical protein
MQYQYEINGCQADMFCDISGEPIPPMTQFVSAPGFPHSYIHFLPQYLGEYTRNEQFFPAPVVVVKESDISLVGTFGSHHVHYHTYARAHISCLLQQNMKQPRQCGQVIAHTWFYDPDGNKRIPTGALNMFFIQSRRYPQQARFSTYAFLYVDKLGPWIAQVRIEQQERPEILADLEINVIP